MIVKTSLKLDLYWTYKLI